MSNLTKPIYNLTPLAINYLFMTLENNGQQFIGGALNLGNYPLIVKPADTYVPAGRYSISNGKRAKKTMKIINVYELKDGTWLYSTPLYKLGKINGSTLRSKDDPTYVYPSNALAVYQVTVSWEDELNLDAINLEIVKYA